VEDLRNLTAFEFDARLMAVCDRYGWRLDGVTRVLWIPDWLEKNPPQSPNVVTSWTKLLGNVPECDLKFEAIAAMGDYLKSFKPSFREPFESYRQRLSKGSRKPQSKPEPQSLSHQGSGIRDPRSENKGTGARRADGSDGKRALRVVGDVDERWVSIAGKAEPYTNPDADDDVRVSVFHQVRRTEGITEEPSRTTVLDAFKAAGKQASA
jgi:hypothetical protein